MATKSTFTFLTTILLTTFFTIVISLLSNNFFMSNFKEIEREQNLDKINVVIDILDKELERIDRVINDYAIWDDTYEFINSANKEYIYENFREGTDTLEDLKLDFIIFTNKSNKILFSKYVKKDFFIKNIDFEKKVLKKFNKDKSNTEIYKHEASRIINLENKYFFITKKPISDSENSMSHNGYIFSGHMINDDTFNSMAKVFKKVSLKQVFIEKSDFVINSKYLKDIKVNTYENDEDCDCLENVIQIYDSFGNYVVSLITTSSREIVEQGKNTIFYYSIAIFLFVFTILYFMVRDRNRIKDFNEILRDEVKERTKKLNETNQKLKKLAEEDELTNINNRRNFFKLSNDSLKDAKKTNKELLLAMVDLDDFKRVNDTYGHAVGDLVLKAFASCIKDILDGKHIFGRLGGEEFAITFKDITYDEAYDLTEVIRQKVSDIKISNDDETISFTISIGLTTTDDIKSIDEGLQRADTLLYQAKERGKNCIIRTRR